MSDTFAGKHACDARQHARPFVIEWDATDMSSFESLAASDVVLVRYEGCELTVLDRCRDESVRGKFGAYQPVDWTSGQLETVEIGNEGELYAKLPLGVASLAGRARAGEKFHMEYYVAGTRNASRAELYRSELAKQPGCSGATHFVSGFNLGAFALGSGQHSEAEANGSVYGFGAGASMQKNRQIDKQGGNLRLCRSDAARELDGCKSPIRLTLREIHEGSDPARAADSAADDGASLNAAGKLAAGLEMSAQARAHFESAQVKLGAGDGAGCLHELDAHDALDAKHKSSDAKGGLGAVRAQCLMVSGQCDAGKQLARKVFEATSSADTPPEQHDRAAEGLAARYCQGANMSERDQYLQAIQVMAQSGSRKLDASACQKAYDTFLRLRGKLKPQGENDVELVNAQRLMSVNAPQCFARAGDCQTAYRVFVAEFPGQGDDKLTPEAKSQLRHAQFDSMIAACKGKLKP